MVCVEGQQRETSGGTFGQTSNAGLYHTTPVPGKCVAKNCECKEWHLRILLFYQKREGVIDLEEMPTHCELLADYNVKSLGDVFEKMLIENNGKSPVQYRLTASAKELFFKCSKPNEDAPLTQGAATGGSMVRAPGSKKTKNTLRIAFNMHILYHHL